ncbi:unnamed protein product [Cochlearia groenlandica]
MSLDLNLCMYNLPNTLSEYLDQVSKITDSNLKLSEIDGFVGKLEEEMKKIHVFKRELPICMILLNEAIEAVKEEGKKGSPVRASNEKLDVSQGAKSETDNKKTWLSLSSAHLKISNQNQSRNEQEEKEGDLFVNTTQNPIQTCNQRGAFLPFNPPPPPPPLAPLPLLPLMTPTSDIRIEQNHHHHHHHQEFNKPLHSHHTQKKEQRRRWSQELHRKFVDALHRLGGSQVATPKQIRDLMQVDGLTNDEVKSHLQKYRMHIRKHPLHPVKTMSCSDRETQSLISLSRSDSPPSPLVVERGLFCDNVFEEDERSDGRSWRNETMKKRQQQVLDLEL